MSEALSHIKYDGVLAPAISCRDSTRFDLASGAIVGRSIQFPSSVSAARALDFAVCLASRLALPVSVRIDGPLRALPSLVADALSRTGVAPGFLEIALTAETLDAAAIECLVALSAVRDLGTDVALHDFGGPGTLDLVQYLPLSTVILKPSLLVDTPARNSAATLVHTILGVARNQGLRAVATGIESEMQRALLSGLGCRQGEGSLFGTCVQQTDFARRTLPKH